MISRTEENLIFNLNSLQTLNAERRTPNIERSNSAFDVRRSRFDVVGSFGDSSEVRS